jgi:hypothetical protein
MKGFSAKGKEILKCLCGKPTIERPQEGRSAKLVDDGT